MSTYIVMGLVADLVVDIYLAARSRYVEGTKRGRASIRRTESIRQTSKKGTDLPSPSMSERAPGEIDTTALIWKDSRLSLLGLKVPSN